MALATTNRLRQSSEVEGGGEGQIFWHNVGEIDPCLSLVQERPEGPARDEDGQLRKWAAHTSKSLHNWSQSVASAEGGAGEVWLRFQPEEQVVGSLTLLVHVINVSFAASKPPRQRLE